ncbi:hypothetical protein [Candidatus Palauibacter sp.]|uniref:hypothetical protein n=1 Tax=Candidatus Palauibacter sp. TaxID=3101350 RepID=UPI003B5162C7
MISKTWTRMPGVIALAALLTPGGTTAQEPEYRPSGQLGPGMVLDGDGGWRPPTPADALGALRGDPDVALPVGVKRFDPVLAVLQQEYGPHPAAELDGLADMILASENPEDMTDEYHIQSDIFSTLATAARGGRFTPHSGSFDALVRVYETIASEALAGGGTDPVEELERRSGPSGDAQLRSALRSVFNADRSGRGADYVLAVIAASEPPKLEDWRGLPSSLWCEAASIVRARRLPPEENPRRGELPDSALDDDMFYQLCRRH